MAVKKKPATKKSTKAPEKTSAFVNALKKKGKGILKAFSSAKKGGGFELSAIKNGVYKTRWSAKSGISKDGDPYIMLLWIVTTGKFKGEKGSRYFNMSDTDQAAWASSMLQSILDVDVAGCDDEAEIKDLLDQLNDDRPVTKTKIERKKTKKGEFINCFIQEIVDDEEDDEESEEDDDDEESEEEDEDSDESDEESEDDEEEEEESDEKEDEVDYATLGEEADGGDKAALKELKRLAKEAEVDPDDYEDWASLAEALSEPSEDDEEEEEDEESDEDDSEEDEEDEVVEPSKGDEFEYKPPRSKRTYEVIVTRVNKSKETVALEEKDGEQTWKDVPWDKLISP